MLFYALPALTDLENVLAPNAVDHLSLWTARQGAWVSLAELLNRQIATAALTDFRAPCSFVHYGALSASARESGVW